MFTQTLDEIFTVKNLKKTYALISTKSTGLDEVSVAFFEEDLEENIAEITEGLFASTYAPEPLSRIYIPKRHKDEVRPLGIGAIKDKLVQKHLAIVLGNYFESFFSDKSYGYRPRKGTLAALNRVKDYLRSGYLWVYRLDIDNFFDTIPHDRLLALLEEHIADKKIVDLIALFVHNGSFERYRYLSHTEGVHQGDPLSPLLANVYLHQLDMSLEWAGIAFVRFADDITLFAKTKPQLQTAAETLHASLHDLHLLADPIKSREYHATKEGFDLLGIAFKGREIAIEKHKFDSMIYDLQQITKTIHPFSDMIEKLNEKLQGIRRYYLKFVDEEHPQFRLMQDALLIALANRVELERKRGAITTKKGFRSLLELVVFPVEMAKMEKKDFIKRIISRGFEAYLAGKSYKKSRDKIARKKQVYAKKYATSSVLYVSEVGTFLGIAKNTIVLKEKGKVILRMPKNQCERIIIASRSVAISGGVVKVCADMGIAIDFIDPFAKTPPYASLYGHKNAYAKMTLRQLQILNTPRQVQCAKAFIKGKVKNQINYLKYLNKYHRRFDEPILAMERKLREMMLQARDPGELMGYEGQCALNYWHALSNLLEDKVHFSHRVTQGAKDVVNASLNYAYAILYSRIQYHAVKAGLSIHVSFLHALYENKPTLVYDMIEEFRAFVVDRVVFSMFSKGEPIKLDKDGRLTRKSRQLITQAVLEKLGAFTRHKKASKKIDTIISEQAYMLARSIKTGTRYKPFIGKY